MRLIIIFISCFVFASFMQAQDVYLWQVMKNRSIVVWGKSSGDEFMGKQLDERKWSYNYDWGKNGYGTGDYALKENLVVKDGVLKLIVKKEKFKTRGIPWMPDTSILNDKIVNLREWDYSNAVLFSKKKYKYGIYECKFKSPAEVGTWPAFWIYTVAPNKEIDMFEGKGERNRDVHIDIHNKPYSSWFGGWIRLDKPLSERFATVRAHWDSNLVMLYLNNQMVSHYFGKINVEGNLITNNTIVSRKISDDQLGQFLYPMDSTTQFPNEMVVDYIRIWEKPLRTIERSSEAIITTKEQQLWDENLASIEKKIGLTNRKKWKFKRYKAQPNYEIQLEVNKITRSLTFNLRGNKNEVVKLSIEDKNGVARFEVPDMTNPTYNFVTSYLGGNVFKVKIKYSKHEVEQLIDFKNDGD
jgi:Glycosyl hydrolases family 16